MIEIVPLDFTTGANVLVSNKGLAACLYFKTFAGTWRPGAGAMWGHGPTLYLFGCDVKDYKVVIKHALSGDTVIGDIVPQGRGRRSVGRRRRDADRRPRQLGRPRPATPGKLGSRPSAAQAGPDPVDIPAGLPGTVMAFKGADAPPHVILHGPSGQVFDTGSGNAPVQAPGFAALKNDATRHHRDRHREARRRPLDGRAGGGLVAARAGHPGRRHAPGDRDRQGHRLRPRPPPRLHGQGPARPAAASSSSRPATAAAGASASSRPTAAAR